MRESEHLPHSVSMSLQRVGRVLTPYWSRKQKPGNKFGVGELAEGREKSLVRATQVLEVDMFRRYS